MFITSTTTDTTIQNVKDYADAATKPLQKDPEVVDMFHVDASGIDGVNVTIREDPAVKVTRKDYGRQGLRSRARGVPGAPVRDTISVSPLLDCC